MLFKRIGRLVYRRRKAVLALTAAFVAFGGSGGRRVRRSRRRLSTTRESIPAGRRGAEDDLGRDAADVVVLYRAPAGS